MDKTRLEVLKLLMAPAVAIMAGAAKRVLEVRVERLRRPLERKNVEGCARAAMRRIEEDDIRKYSLLWVFVRAGQGAWLGYEAVRLFGVRNGASFIGMAD